MRSIANALSCIALFAGFCAGASTTACSTESRPSCPGPGGARDGAYPLVDLVVRSHGDGPTALPFELSGSSLRVSAEEVTITYQHEGASQHVTYRITSGPEPPRDPRTIEEQCNALDPQACEIDSRCRVLRAWRAGTGADPRLGEEVSVGCMRADHGCGDAETCAMKTLGWTPHLFRTTCIPPDWVVVDDHDRCFEHPAKINGPDDEDAGVAPSPCDECTLEHQSTTFTVDESRHCGTLWPGDDRKDAERCAVKHFEDRSPFTLVLHNQDHELSRSVGWVYDKKKMHKLHYLTQGDCLDDCHPDCERQVSKTTCFKPRVEPGSKDVIECGSGASRGLCDP